MTEEPNHGNANRVTRVEESGLFLAAHRTSFRGGTSELIRCPSLDGHPLLYKKYRDDVLGSIDESSLESLIEFPLHLAPGELDRLHLEMAWPTRIVEANGELKGVLLPEAPSDFFESGNASTRRLGRLARPHGDEHYFELPQKLARLGRLVSLVAWLHEHDIVVGDLQPNNILISAPGSVPAIFLVDCDSMSYNGKWGLPRRDPGNWKIPGDGQFSVETDYAKLALLVLRCLAEDLIRNEPLEGTKFSDLMPQRDLDLINRSTNGKPPSSDIREWGAVARAWISLDSGDRLGYRSDTLAWALWPPDRWEVSRYSAMMGEVSNIQPIEEVVVLAPNLPKKPKRTPDALSEDSGPSRLKNLAFWAMAIVAVSCLVIVWSLAIISATSGGFSIYPKIFSSHSFPGTSRGVVGQSLALMVSIIAVLIAGLIGYVFEASHRYIWFPVIFTAFACASVFLFPPSQLVHSLAADTIVLGYLLP